MFLFGVTTIIYITIAYILVIDPFIGYLGYLEITLLNIASSTVFFILLSYLQYNNFYRSQNKTHLNATRKINHPKNKTIKKRNSH